MHPKLIKSYTKWKKYQHSWTRKVGMVSTTVQYLEESSEIYVVQCPDTPQSTPPNTSPCCAHCQTSSTPLWRKVVEDRSKPTIKKIVCNACGIYYNVHGKRRPLVHFPRFTKRPSALDVLAETSIEFEHMLTQIFIEPYRMK